MIRIRDLLHSDLYCVLLLTAAAASAADVDAVGTTEEGASRLLRFKAQSPSRSSARPYSTRHSANKEKRIHDQVSSHVAVKLLPDEYTETLTD